MAATFISANDPLRPYLKLRGDVYWITRKPERTLGTKDLKEAQRAYDKRIPLGKPSKGNVRCKDAFATWIAAHRLRASTREQYQGAWDRYCAHVLGGLFVQQVTVEHIIRIYSDARNGVTTFSGKPVSEGRIGHIQNCLGAFFTSMTKQPTRYRLDNPMRELGDYAADPPRTGVVGVDEILSKEEVDTLIHLASIPTRPKADEVLFAKQLSLLIEVLAYGGMRIGEALALEITDLGDKHGRHGEWFIGKQVNLKRDKDDPTTWFTGQKNDKTGKVGGKVRHVPIMTAELRARIDAYIAEGLRDRWLKPGGLLFPTATGKVRLVADVDKRFRTLADRAGFGEAHRAKPTVLHHLRHTFASWLLESGEYDLSGIALLIGDSLKVCTDRYAHLGHREHQHDRAVNAMAVRHGLQEAVVEALKEEGKLNVIHVDFAARRAS